MDEYMDHNCDDGDFPKKYGCFSLRRFLVGGIFIGIFLLAVVASFWAFSHYLNL
jgi:hypothetical protein